MIFYLIPAAGGQPRELAGTQADARALCKVHGLKFDAETMAHDVPTDKAGLMNYVNVLMHEDDGVLPGTNQPHLTTDEPTVIENMREAEEVRADNPLHPGYTSPWSARQVLADMDVNAMASVIKQIDGRRLAKVSVAVIERMEALRQELPS